VFFLFFFFSFFFRLRLRLAVCEPFQVLYMEVGYVEHVLYVW